MSLPTYANVEAAARQIADAVNHTPVFTSRTVDKLTGAEVHFKCEQFQRAGAFKFRGAYHTLSRLTTYERRRGVVTFSSGNHGQAIALAGQILDIPRVLVMPFDSPPNKRRAAQAYGGEIVLYDRDRDDREVIARRIADERGLTLISPYDHPDVIAGQGTVAKELIEKVGRLDVLLVPCGGGGLLAASALTAGALAPGCQVIGIEPAAGDDATRSFRTKILQHVHNPQTVADGARTRSLGQLTFRLILQHVSDMVTVDDAQLLKTMFFIWERLKLVVEPTGALAAAALLEGKASVAGRRVGVILSGGNVDLAKLPEWLQYR